MGRCPRPASPPRPAGSARLVEPLYAHYAAAGDEQPRLRAEFTVAAVADTLLGRHSGAFPALADAAPEELTALLRELLDPPPHS